MIISRPPGQFPWCNAGVVLLEPTLIRTPNNRDLCSWWDSLCLCLSSLFPSTGVLEQHNLETHFFFFRRTTTQRADWASAAFELTIIKKNPLLSLIMMSTWRRDPPWRPAGSPRTPAQTSAPAPDAWGSNECVAACISMTDDSALSRACIITLSFILVLNYWCLHSLCLLQVQGADEPQREGREGEPGVGGGWEGWGGLEVVGGGWPHFDSPHLHTGFTSNFAGSLTSVLSFVACDVVVVWPVQSIWFLGWKGAWLLPGFGDQTTETAASLLTLL